MLLGLLALAARMFRADAQSLWYDEGSSAALATRAARTIIAAAAADIHPPLYYLLLAAWARAFGDGVVALRGLSAVLGALGVVGAYVLVRRLAGRLPAVTAALLAAGAPFLVWYGQEVRMYVLAAAIAPWLVWTALRLLDGRQPPSPRRRAALFGAAAALTLAALYTHYLAGASVVIAANTVALGALIARWRGRGRDVDGANPMAREVVAWSGAQLLAALLFAPWLARVWPSISGWPALAGPVSAGFIAREALETYAFGVSAPPGQRALWPLVAALAGLGAIVGIADRRWRGAALVGLAMAAVPPALIWAASLRRPAWQPKFLTGGAAGFELLLALGILAPFALARGRGAQATAIGGMAAFALAALVVAPRLAALRADLYDPAYQRDDYRGIAAAIDAAAGPDDAVVLTAPTQVEIYDYYDGGAHRAYPLPEARPPDRAATEARLGALSVTHRDIFGILWATGEADPDGIVEGWLNANRFKAYDRWFGNVRLALWAAERAPTRAVDGLPVRFGGALVLRRLTHGPLAAAPGDVLTLTAEWAVAAPPVADARLADVTVFVHLVAADGTVAAQRDMRPVGGSAATSAWVVGEPPVVDRIALALPEDLAPGGYDLLLGVYDPASGQRLAARASGEIWPALRQEAVVVGSVAVVAASDRLP